MLENGAAKLRRLATSFQCWGPDMFFGTFCRYKHLTPTRVSQLLNGPHSSVNMTLKDRTKQHLHVIKNLNFNLCSVWFNFVSPHAWKWMKHGWTILHLSALKNKKTQVVSRRALRKNTTTTNLCALFWILKKKQSASTRCFPRRITFPKQSARFAFKR